MSWKDTTQLSCIRWSAPNRSVIWLMTGVTVYNELPRSIATFVTVNNKLPCSIVQVILLQHGYCTFVTILFGPFTWLFINLAMRVRALFPQIYTHCPTWWCHFSQNGLVQKDGWFCSVLKRSSHRVLQNSAFEFLLQSTKILDHPMNQPTPLLWSTA